MVGSDMLFIIHKRLSEINGTTNKLFGGVSVLAFSDLRQLPPLGHFAVYKLPKSKMAKLYGTVWNDFNGFELTEIMRQQEDQDFAKLLTRVRKKEISNEDKKQLESREISKSDPDYPSDAVHVFATMLSQMLIMQKNSANFEDQSIRLSQKIQEKRSTPAQCP